MVKNKLYKLLSITLIIINLFSLIVYAADKDKVFNSAPRADITGKKVPPKNMDLVIATDYSGSKLSELSTVANQFKAKMYSKNVDVNINIVDSTSTLRQYQKLNARGYTVDVYDAGPGAGFDGYNLNIAKIVAGNLYYRISKFVNSPAGITGGYYDFIQVAEFNKTDGISNAIQVRFLTSNIIFVLDRKGNMYKVTYSDTDSKKYTIEQINKLFLNEKEKVIKICLNQGKPMLLTNKGKVFTESNGTYVIVKNFDGAAVKIKDISDSIILDTDGNIYFYGTHTYIPYRTDPIEPYENPYIYKYYDFEKFYVNGDYILSSEFYNYGWNYGHRGENVVKTKDGKYKKISIVNNNWLNSGKVQIIDRSMPTNFDYIDDEFMYNYYKMNDGTVSEIYYSNDYGWKLNTDSMKSQGIYNKKGFKFFVPIERMRDYNSTWDWCKIDRSGLVFEDSLCGYNDADIPQTHIGASMIDNEAIMDLKLSKDADRYLLYVSDGEGNDVKKPYGEYYGLGNLNKFIANYLHGHDFTVYGVCPSSIYNYELDINPNQEMSLQELMNNSNNEGKFFERGQIDNALGYIYDLYVAYTPPKTVNNKVDAIILTDYTGNKEQALISNLNDIKDAAKNNNVDINFKIINNQVKTNQIGNYSYKIMNTTDNIEADWYTPFYDYKFEHINEDDKRFNYTIQYKFLDIFNSPKTIAGIADICMATRNIVEVQYPEKSYTYLLRTDGTVWKVNNDKACKIPELNKIVQILSYNANNLYALDKDGKVYVYGNDTLRLNMPNVGAWGPIKSEDVDTKFYNPVVLDHMNNVKYLIPLKYGYIYLNNDGQVIYYGRKFYTSGTYERVRVREWDDYLERYVYVWKTVNTANYINQEAPYNLNTLLKLPGKVKQICAIPLQKNDSNNGSIKVYFLLENGSVFYYDIVVNTSDMNGNFDLMPKQINELGINNIKIAVAAKYNSSGIDNYNLISLKSNRTVVGTGNNKYGELGQGHTNNITNYVTIPDLTNITDMQLTNYGAYFLKNDGTLYRTGAIYNCTASWSNDVIKDQVTAPKVVAYYVKMFAANNIGYLIIDTLNNISEAGVIYYSNSSTYLTYKGLTFKGTLSNPISINKDKYCDIYNTWNSNSSVYSVIRCKDGNYYIGDTRSVIGGGINAYPTSIDFNGYEILDTKGSSIYLYNKTNNKYYGIGDTSDYCFNLNGGLYYSHPFDITSKLNNTADKIIWLTGKITNSNSVYRANYKWFFTFTEKKCVKNFIQSEYAVLYQPPSYMYPTFPRYIAQNQAWQYTYGGNGGVDYWGLINAGTPYLKPSQADTPGAIQWYNDWYLPINIFADYKDYCISYVNIDDVLYTYSNVLDKYFIYISDGKGHDFSNNYGDYYSFGNLDYKLKIFLINNGYNINAISPPVTYDYILPQSEIQELTIKELVNGSTLKGRLFANTLMDEGLNKIFKKYMVEKESNVITILKDEDMVDYKITYQDFEGHPIKAQRWKYEHDPNYYETPNGLADFSGNWIDAAVTKFTKKGEYKVTFNAQDTPTNEHNFNEYDLWSNGANPLIIRVHERPIADFNLLIDNGVLDYVDKSYDKDHISEIGKGIVQRKWYWMNLRDGSMGFGLPDSHFKDDIFEISLMVKDKEGAWSLPCTRRINMNLNIDAVPTHCDWRNTPLTVTINVTADEGTLKEAVYQWSKSTDYPSPSINNWTNINTYTLPLKLVNEGVCYLHMMAEDIYGNIAYRNRGSYKIDLTPPVINISSNSGSMPWAYNLELAVSDNLSGVKETWTRWTNTDSSISDLTGFTKLSGSTVVGPSIDGTYYLHIKSWDNAENTNYKIYGPYKVENLTVAASVAPNPAKQGQKVIFKVYTTGYPKYIVLYFPLKMSTVPISVQIPEKANHTEYIPYYVPIKPIKTPMTIDRDGNRLTPPYEIIVKAIKADGTFKTTTVNLDVKGSILDGIKTEILNN